jgi:hypothetical protein
MLTLLLWAALGGAPQADAGTALPGSGPQDSGAALEAYLRRMRERERATSEGLKAPIEALVARLEALGKPEPRAERQRLQDELFALGPSAGRLLVPYLEPDPSAEEQGGEAQRFRAREIAAALARLVTPASTEALVHLANEGRSVLARQLAVRVLGSSPDRERAERALAEIFRGSDVDLRLEAVLALTRQGSSTSTDVLAEALIGSPVDAARAILDALADGAALGAAPAVRALVERPDRAAPLVDGILRYYLVCATAQDDATTLALLALPARASLDAGAVRRVLDLVMRNPPALTNELRVTLAPLLASSDAEVAESARILLALLGDRTARRDVLRTYDEVVARNDVWARAYEQRAEVLIRLRQYDEAVKDLRVAIDLRSAQNGGEFELVNDRIELARAYCLDAKLRPAHDVLEEARLAKTQMQVLAEDPDFRALREHPRYGKLFE